MLRHHPFTIRVERKAERFPYLGPVRLPLCPIFYRKDYKVPSSCILASLFLPLKLPPYANSPVYLSGVQGSWLFPKGGPGKDNMEKKIRSTCPGHLSPETMHGIEKPSWTAGPVFPNDGSPGYVPTATCKSSKSGNCLTQRTMTDNNMLAFAKSEVVYRAAVNSQSTEFGGKKRQTKPVEQKA